MLVSKQTVVKCSCLAFVLSPLTSPSLCSPLPSSLPSHLSSPLIPSSSLSSPLLSPLPSFLSSHPIIFPLLFTLPLLSFVLDVICPSLPISLSIFLSLSLLVWLTNQQLQNSIAFLPVNPTISPMRNQGRQKLATLDAKEFSLLVIDLLLDTKRRQNISLETGEWDPSIIINNGNLLVKTVLHLHK